MSALDELKIGDIFKIQDAAAIDQLREHVRILRELLVEAALDNDSAHLEGAGLWSVNGDFAHRVASALEATK